jgi:hypothetical protein
MLSHYSKRQITHLDPVEGNLPIGMAILSTPLCQDGFFISREISMGFVRRGKDSPQWRGGKSTTSNGRYETTFLPDHHRADVRGYVLTHILIAEKALGKPIPAPIEVHHHNESQLVICQDRFYHRLLHRRMNALKSCGNVHWHKCYICKKI